jgi:hypothetical protein
VHCLLRRPRSACADRGEQTVYYAPAVRLDHAWLHRASRHWFTKTMGTASQTIARAGRQDPFMTRLPRANAYVLTNKTASIEARSKPLDRQLQQLVASRREAESAIAIAMITSAIPGIEVYELEQEFIVLPSTA